MGRFGGATVKVASRKRQQPLLRRLIQLLYPFEVYSKQEAPVDAVSDKFQNLESETQPQEENIPTEPPPNSPNQEMRQSSQHIAANQADERRKDYV